MKTKTNLIKLSFLILFLFYNSIVTNGQQQLTIKSQILDKKTLEPIPYATIFNSTTKNGTASNLDGYFKLNGNSIGDTILISFIGYQEVVIILDGNDFESTIYLAPKAALLNEITVIADNSFLYKLIAACRKKKNTSLLTAKTYFSLESFARDEQVELLECYYNGTFSNQDVKNLNLKNGRIALAEFDNRFFVSTETSKAIYLHSLFERNNYFPKSPFYLKKRKMKKQFNLKLTAKYKDEDNHTIYVIDYFPKKENGEYFSGSVWIDSMSQQIDKVDLRITDAAISPFVPIARVDALIQTDFHITKDYKSIEGKNYVQSINFDYELKYKTRNNTNYSIKTNALLYAYDYNNQFTIPFFEFTNISYVDYRKINGSPYNDFFWENINEFKLNDLQNKNLNFLEKKASINNQTLFVENSFFDKGMLENSYIFWSGRNGKRIQFRPNFNKKNKTQSGGISDDPYKKYKTQLGEIPSDRYQLTAQIYMDINEFNDSLHVITQTIFDPFNTFYLYPRTAKTNAFINMYFDLIEIQRRELEKEISEKGKTVEQIKTLYQQRMKTIKKQSEEFFNEVNRGENGKAMLEWNEYIVRKLDIDNMALFKLIMLKK